MRRLNAVVSSTTVGLDRSAWLEERKKGIGSSDAASAVGLCPYRSPLELWAQKTGSVPVSPLNDDVDSPTYWGTVLEPLVADAYAKATGRRVRRVNAVLQHPTFPFMLANLDREVVGTDEVRILECKTAGEHGSRKWRAGVPEHIQIQVQHQLAVTGQGAADVAVLLCGQELQIHRIERDDEVISRLVILEARFWELVTSGTPPAADGSASSAKALRELYRGSDTVIDLGEQDGLLSAFERLLALGAELDEREREAERHRQAIQQAMGEASVAAFGPLGEAHFKRAKDSLVLNVKKLEADHPALVASYRESKPGARRFRLVTTPKENPQ